MTHNPSAKDFIPLLGAFMARWVLVEELHVSIFSQLLGFRNRPEIAASILAPVNSFSLRA